MLGATLESLRRCRGGAWAAAYAALVGCTTEAGSSSPEEPGRGGAGASDDGGGGGGGGDATRRTTGEADWTMLGYDAASTYNNTAETRITKETAKDLTIAHRIDMGVTIYGAPVIVGDTICVTGGAITCVDAVSGDKLWENAERTFTSSALAYRDGRLYALHNDAVLRAYDIEDGTLLWERPTSDQPGAEGFSSPMIGGDLVVVGGSTFEEMSGQVPTFRGFVYAADRDTGEEAWSTFTVGEGETGASLWSTVAMDIPRGKVYGATGNNYAEPATTTSDAILQFDMVDGNLDWAAQRYEGDIWSLATAGLGNPDYDFGANPIVFDAEVSGEVVGLVGGGQKSGDVHVLRRATGEELWTRNLCAGGAAGDRGVFNNGAWSGTYLLWACNGATSDAAGGDPAGITGSSVLFAIDPETGDIVWERQLGGVVVAPITVAGGVGFVGADTELQAFDTETGGVLYRLPLEATVGSAPSVGNGWVAFGAGFTWLFGTPGTDLVILRVP